MAEFPVDIVRFLQQAGDPGPTLLTGKLFTKDDGFGVTKLYYEDSAGVVVPLSDTELIILYECRCSATSTALRTKPNASMTWAS